MSPERLEHLHSLVGPKITKRDTNFRRAISSGQRLAVTVRFLASGDSIASLHFEYYIGLSTLSTILSETCLAIYEVLRDQYFCPPKNSSDWRRISEDFERMWNFPHVIGAIDGKHIAIESPPNTGTLYHNYKSFFSFVLLAICDARYNFILVDIGQYGSNNDSGVLRKSLMGKAFEDGDANLPTPEKLSGCPVDPLPYFLVGDDIFPLTEWLMRPFPGELTEVQKIYNYRISRARRVIENTFGILRARWRIFSTTIKASVENAERYVLAAISLHNYLRQTENASYCPFGFIDSESSNGAIKPGDWRSALHGEGCLQNVRPVRGSRPHRSATDIREALVTYVNSDIGMVPWQLEHVRRT